MRKFSNNILTLGLTLIYLFTLTGLAGQMDHTNHHHAPDENKIAADHFKMGNMQIPNTDLINQDGETVKLQELIKGKVVAMNFIFTTCTTICPPMGANFVQLKNIMADHVDKDLVMISVSIDPKTDTPERLKVWSEKFQPGVGWTLLTGTRQSIDDLLKKLKVFTPLIDDHAPIIMIGKDGTDDWIRTNGLAKPEKLAEILNQKLNSSTAEVEDVNNSELNYFTDTKLLNQYGAEMRFYTDLLKGKTVIINPFFSECTGSCPAMHARMMGIQEHFGDRIGKDVHIISITVDEKNDQVDKLEAYAKRFNAKKGWYFLTGSKENLDIVRQKIGKSFETREQHDNIFLIGNTSTRLWKKANGLATVADLIPIVESVLNDKG